MVYPLPPHLLVDFRGEALPGGAHIDLLRRKGMSEKLHLPVMRLPAFDGQLKISRRDGGGRFWVCRAVRRGTFDSTEESWENRCPAFA